MKYRAFKVDNSEDFIRAIKLGVKEGFGISQFASSTPSEVADEYRMELKRNYVSPGNSLAVLFYTDTTPKQILFNRYETWKEHRNIAFEELTNPWEEIKKLFKYA